MSDHWMGPGQYCRLPCPTAAGEVSAGDQLVEATLAMAGGTSPQGGDRGEAGRAAPVPLHESADGDRAQLGVIAERGISDNRQRHDAQPPLVSHVA